MKLALATLACLPRRELDAVFNAGCLSKAEIGAVNALRSSGGRANDAIAKKKLTAALHKHFAGAASKQMQKLARGVYEYAKHRFAEQQEIKLMTTADDLLQEHVSKSRDTQRMLRDTIRKYQAAHPGCNRADAIDAVLFSGTTREMVALEHRIDDVAKAKNTLPQPRATTHIDFSNPLRGTAGYNADLDAAHPGTAHASGGPQSGKEPQPKIEDANDVLERLTKEGMKAGKSRARAVMDASVSKEFSEAFRKERERKFGA
jgi:hypothetical protein